MPPVADGTTTVSGRRPARRGLLGELQAGEHLADRPDDPRPADRDEIRAAARRAELGHDAVDDGGALGAVVGRGLVDRRAEQLVESDARIGRVDRRAGQDEVDGKARLRAGRRGQPGMVRPAPAGGHQRVGALGQRGPDEELEVAQLVATERERQEVLALDPDLGPAAERRGEARQRRQRRRTVEQREARERAADRGPR